MLSANNVKRNEWKVPPDNTVQVVDPNGLKEPITLSRNWNGIWISLGIISVVCSLVALAATFVGPFEPTLIGRSLQISDLGSSQIYQTYEPLQWITDHDLFYSSHSEGLLILDVETKKSKKLLASVLLSQTGASKYSLSPDQRYILLEHNVIVDHVFTQTASFCIYDIERGLSFMLRIERAHDRFEHVEWCGGSADTADPSGLVVLLQGDVYYLPSPQQHSLRLTNSGNTSDVSNGSPDLLYEDILKGNSAVWSNPSGTLLAVTAFNSTGVKVLPTFKYNNVGSLYVDYVKYATVSTSIPTWNITVYNIEAMKQANKKFYRLALPLNKQRHFYLLGFGWIDNRKVWLSYLSRDHSLVGLITCEVVAEKCRRVFSKQNDDSRMPLLQNVVWDGPWAAFVWPVRSQTGTLYNGVIAAKNEHHMPPIVVREHTILKLIEYSRDARRVLFLATEHVAAKSHVYKMSLDDQSISCITCSLSSRCTSASLSPEHTNVVVSCTSTMTHHLHVISLKQNLKLLTLNSKPIRYRWDSKEVALPVHEYETMYFQNQLQVSVDLKFPPYWTPEDVLGSYPVVIEIAPMEETGTGNQEAVGWSDILVSSHRVAHARIQIEEASVNKFSSIDALASAFDTTIRRVFEKYPVLNQKAVFGWGRGSGASCILALSNVPESNLDLACIAAVNPIFDWTEYSSFWSERILGPKTTDDGRGNYGKSHLARMVPLLNNSLVMLVQNREHTSSEHSYQFAASLIQASIHFKHIVYSGNRLGVQDESQHLAQSMLNFFLQQKCIGGYLIEDS